jgi:hypothetical protein
MILAYRVQALLGAYVGAGLEYTHSSGLSVHHHCVIQYLMDTLSLYSVVPLGTQDHVCSHSPQASGILCLLYGG